MTLEMRTPARARKSRLVTLIVAIMAFVLATPQMAFAAVSSTPDQTSQVQGIVYSAFHLNSGRTIVGGEFTGIGSFATSNIGAILPNTTAADGTSRGGTADRNFLASTNGIVYAVAANANQTVIYLGGTFTQVNGVPRANLAAVDAVSGKLIESWTADTNGAVRALEVVGDTLYVGGSFNTLDGSQRGRLVALNPSGNYISTTFNARPDWTVRDLASSPGAPGKLYVSGGFNNIGGAPRDSAAEIDAITGKATAFTPDTNTDTGLAVDVTPDGKTMFFSVPNNEVYAFNLVDGTAGTRVWTTKGGGDTQAIESTDTEVFIGGHFRNITTYKVKRNMVASLHRSNGTVTDWNPHISGNMGPWSIHYTSSKLVVGGDFGWIGGQPRKGLGRFTVS